MTTDSTSTDEAGRRDASALQRGVRPHARELASVPIFDRGIGWQADATATLKEQAALIDDLAMMLKVCAWALRRGTSPTLGERALVLLSKHGLMGSPLRAGTRCTRLGEDGEPCGLEPPCPDCGRACHDLPDGA